MPVPSVIGDLSTSAGANSPPGSEGPQSGDDYIRSHASFIAQLRDKLNGTSDTGTVKNATFSGTMVGEASWAGLQTFAAGIASSADSTALGVSIVRAKSATTSRSSTTTLADDPHLVVPLSAGTWAVEMMVPIWATTSGAGGYKASFAFSGTATSSAFGFGGLTNAASLLSYINTIGGSISETSIDVQNGVNGAAWLTVHGTITVTVAGNLSLRWAQQSSNSNALNVGVGGWLSCLKVA